MILYSAIVFVAGMVAETFLGWGAKIRKFVKDKA